MDVVDLMLHPIRLRIVHAMTGQDTQTTSELADRLADVPRTSLYRHVALLAEAGLLEVVEERRVRGSVERRYRLHRERSLIDSDTAAGLSLDDHRRGFAAAMAALIAEFGRYLDHEDADPYADGVGYRQGVVWLTGEERRTMQTAIQNAVRAAAPRPAPVDVPAAPEQPDSGPSGSGLSGTEQAETGQAETGQAETGQAEERRPYLTSLIMFPTEEPSANGGNH